MNVFLVNYIDNDGVFHMEWVETWNEANEMKDAYTESGYSVEITLGTIGGD